MVRLADGDRSAGPIVFALTWPHLTRFAARALGNEADAHDAAQLGLEKIFAQVSSYDRGRSAMAWCLAVVSWECRTMLRRRQRLREEPIENAAGAHAPDLDPEEQAIDAATLTALREALAQLPFADRQTLEGAFFREASGPKTPALRKRKERALDRLRSLWRAIHGD